MDAGHLLDYAFSKLRHTMLIKKACLGILLAFVPATLFAQINLSSFNQMGTVNFSPDGKTAILVEDPAFPDPFGGGMIDSVTSLTSSPLPAGVFNDVSLVFDYSFSGGATFLVAVQPLFGVTPTFSFSTTSASSGPLSFDLTPFDDSDLIEFSFLLLGDGQDDANVTISNVNLMSNTPAPIPEPSGTFVSILLGGTLLGLVRRFR